MTRLHSLALILTLTIAFVSCSRPKAPETYIETQELPVIRPDYTEVTMPSNICPPNFAVLQGTRNVVARFTAPGGLSYTYGEDGKIIIDEDEWAELRNAAKGSGIAVEVFAEVSEMWVRFRPFNIYIAEEDIDPYISYRNIQPSYVAFENIAIRQRNLTNYDESDIYSNMPLSNEKTGQCINCHSYQNYKTSRMLFHMRQGYGGTMIVDEGTVKKVDLKTDSTISAGVYPSWHPQINVIAFSTNNTGQSFHTKDIRKIEVQDTRSDLILYDPQTDEVSIVENDSNELEVFPCWSADGKTLYYCSAHFEYYNDSLPKETEMIRRYKEVHYNLYSKSFDPKTRTFGPSVKIFNADSLGLSATLPRVSPDGKYLVFSLAEFGCFHVWHPDADIQLMDLKTGDIRPLTELNSDQSESYPSFSSNGRWIMTASRRDDGNYTRPYISYFDKNGQCHKAFELPQRDPNFYTFFLRSYNRPEFMIEPVKVTPQEFVSIAREDPKKVTFKSK